MLQEYDSMERMMAKEDSCGRTEYGYNTWDEISLIRDGKGAVRFHYNFMRRQDDTVYPDGSHESCSVSPCAFETAFILIKYPWPKVQTDDGQVIRNQETDKKIGCRLSAVKKPHSSLQTVWRDAWEIISYLMWRLEIPIYGLE